MAAVDGFFDDREDVLGVDLDLTLFRLKHHGSDHNVMTRISPARV
jgi:hypothetical protein